MELGWLEQKVKIHLKLVHQETSSVHIDFASNRIKNSLSVNLVSFLRILAIQWPSFPSKQSNGREEMSKMDHPRDIDKSKNIITILKGKKQAFKMNRTRAQPKQVT